jgi:hypothetical protein
MKVLKWIPVNLASILGVVQAFIKFFKEVLTACVNILFPVLPDGVWEQAVLKARAFVEKADGWVQKAKEWLLKIGAIK